MDKIQIYYTASTSSRQQNHRRPMCYSLRRCRRCGYWWPLCAIGTCLLSVKSFSLDLDRIICSRR